MKNSMMKTMPLDTDLASLVLRLLFGGLFINHGYPKYTDYDNMLRKFEDIIGIGSQLSLNLVIFAELICGIFIAVGFLTRLSVIPIFITMAVAFFIAHADDPFMNKELSFAYMMLSIVVFILGSGRYSVDSLLFRSKAG